ncbi:hypothetical protein WR25_14779 [Diploscapter pachys]|uniref:CRIB domain-containing protein n=1 Tax=Diploscapter pachys TaxID=2018661 RepID=A0A2A2LHW4_9BILA|nr:hypothetical protein WR25_14779 [Diploscapter pachys]
MSNEEVEKTVEEEPEEPIHDQIENSKTGGFLQNLKKKLGDRSSRKKTNLTAADISEPYDFRHINHLGKDSLDKEDRELYDILKEKLKIKEGAKDEERFAMNVVLNRREELRNYIKNDQNGGMKASISTGLDEPAQTSKHDNDNQSSPLHNLELTRQQIATIQDRQTDLVEFRVGFAEVQREHNVQQALLLLRNNANHCFTFINKFKEFYNTMAEKKKAVENVGKLASLNPFRSNSAKAELNDAEVAHRTIKDFLIPALHELMTAFTSFSAAIGSIQLRGASEGQVTTIISTFETHIRDLTDEVSKTSNMQIEKVEQHETEMHSLLDELSDKLQFDANDRLEAKFIEKQEEQLQKVQTYVLPGSLLIESTFDFSFIFKK